MRSQLKLPPLILESDILIDYDGKACVPKCINFKKYVWYLLLLLIIFNVYSESILNILFERKVYCMVYKISQSICILYILSKKLWVSILYILFLMYITHLWFLHILNIFLNRKRLLSIPGVNLGFIFWSLFLWIHVYMHNLH